MLTRYSLHNKSEMERWDEFVGFHPKGSPFHLSCWIKTIHATYSFEPLLYVRQDLDGALSSIVPFFRMRGLFGGTRIVSLPFSDYCGPLCKDQQEENRFMGDIYEAHKDNVACIEIRSILSDGRAFTCHNHYKGHLLELSRDPADLMKHIDKRTVQYSIRKALKSGVEIEEGKEVGDLDQFYRLNKLTRRKHGIPSQPLKYFKCLFEHMILNGNAFILLATYGPMVIAAGLFFKFKETVYYKYNVSDPDSAQKSPNHLLTWHAIQKACSEGYRFFDFGRTSPDNVGLMRYKEMWGAKSSDLPYYYYPKIRGATSTEGGGLPYRILTKVWRSLPDRMVDIIGPKLYKYMA